MKCIEFFMVCLQFLQMPQRIVHYFEENLLLLPTFIIKLHLARYVNCTPTSKVTRSLSGTSAHATMVTLVNIMVNWQRTSFSFQSSGPSIPEIWLFQTVTLKLQGQYHGCGQRARSYSRPSILLIRFLFISHQSDQTNNSWDTAILKFDLETYDQDQGHEWGQRLRSHILPSIQPMHLIFVSHQWDQPFLRYGQNSIWHVRNF